MQNQVPRYEHRISKKVRLYWLLQDALTRVLDYTCVEPCRQCGSDLPSPEAQCPAPRTVCLECWHNVLKPDFQFESFPLTVGNLTLVSCMAYDGFARTLVRALKYEEDRLIADDLSIFLSDAVELLQVVNPRIDDAIVVPIPLAPFREIRRGFNQCRLLAQRLERRCFIPVQDGALRRVKHTKAQHSLSKVERIHNLHNAFRAAPKYVLGRRVILIDDVCTSGATIVSAAEALLTAGATSISALAVCRANLEHGSS